MKKFNFKSLSCLLALSLCVSASQAKQTYFKEADLWSVELSGGARSVITETNHGDFDSPWGASVALSATRSFTPFSGVRGSLDYGTFSRKFIGVESAFTIGIDYTMNFMSIGGLNTYMPFDIYGILGADVTRVNGGFYKGASFGLKLQYNIAHFGIFFEPMFMAYDDTLDGTRDRSAAIYTDLRLGVAYRFGDGYKAYNPADKVDLERVKMENAKLESQVKVYKADKKGLSASSSATYDQLKPLTTSSEKHTAYYNAKAFDNTFISATLGGNLRVDRGLITTDVKELFQQLKESVSMNVGLQYGKWFTPIFAVQANTSWTWNNYYKYGVTTADFMVNVNNYFSGNIDKDKVFFVPFAGIGMAYSFIEDSDMSVSPVVAAGAQIQFKMSDRSRFFIEGRAELTNKNPIVAPYYQGHFITLGGKVGVSVKLNNTKFQEHDYFGALNAKQYVERNKELAKIISAEKQLRSGSKATTKKAKNIAVKEKSQQIHFVESSLYLDLLQRCRLKYIAQWMNSSASNVVTICSFNESGSSVMSEQRSEIIKAYLIECGAPESQINVVTAQEAGYANADSSNSVVIFSSVK